MLWILLLAGVLADHLVTEIGIRRHGIAVEGNPLLREIQRRRGGTAALFFEAAILSGLLAIALRYLPEIAILLPLLVWAVVIANVVALTLFQQGNGEDDLQDRR